MKMKGRNERRKEERKKAQAECWNDTRKKRRNMEGRKKDKILPAQLTAAGHVSFSFNNQTEKYRLVRRASLCCQSCCSVLWAPSGC